MIIPDVAVDLEIPEDGILSKVLYKSDTVRLVGFAFDAGQELTEHTAARPIIVQVVSGSVDFVVDEETTRMDPASWCYLDASVPHSVLAVEPSRLLLTLL
jgi:quercetin dioxygenase-like cupin family protein